MDSAQHGAICVKAVGDALYVKTCGSGHDVEGFKYYGPLLMKLLQKPFKIIRDEWATPRLPRPANRSLTAEQLESEREWKNQEAALKCLKASRNEVAVSSNGVCMEQWMVPSLEVRRMMEDDERIREKKALESSSNDNLASAVVSKKKKHRFFRHSPAGRMRNQAWKKSKAAKYCLAEKQHTPQKVAESAPTRSEKNKTKYNKWKKMRKRRH